MADGPGKCICLHAIVQGSGLIFPVRTLDDRKETVPCSIELKDASPDNKDMEMTVSKGIRLLWQSEIYESVSDWKEAIRLCTEPLERAGFCSPEYKESIITQIEQLGPYCLIRPGIALVHGPLCLEAPRAGLRLMGVRQPVLFEGGKSARLFLGVAAPTPQVYMLLLRKVASLLKNPGFDLDQDLSSPASLFGSFSRLEGEE